MALVKSKGEMSNKLLELFLVRLNPDELSIVFEFRRLCSSITGEYSLFMPFVINTPLEKLDERKKRKAALHNCRTRSENVRA